MTWLKGFVAAVAGVAIALSVSAVAVGKEKKEKKEVTPIALPAPPAGKGQIVFFRHSALGGVVIGCTVHENGQKISSLGSGRYFIMVADPGRHEFTVETEAKDLLALEVEPDETQFASCSIKMGLMSGRPDISPSTEEDFRKLTSMKLVDADDMGPGAGALRPEEIAAALAAQANGSAPAATPAAGVEPPAAATAEESPPPAPGEVPPPAPAPGEESPPAP